MSETKRTAVILAGGVAKGAFEAGALKVLAASGVKVSTVIAASSGSLNATMYAAGIRAGCELRAATTAAELWQDAAGWRDVFDFTVAGLVSGHALSTSDKILTMLRKYVDPLVTPIARPVRLCLVVAPVLGVIGEVGTLPATSFEASLPFDQDSFATDEGRDAIYRAAAASAAFPFVFEPVSLDGLGPCYDGGVVNDTPVKLATDCGAQRVIVIAPYPSVFRLENAPVGLRLLPHLVDMLIHERLYRDLRDATRVNRIVEQLAALGSAGVLKPDQVAAVESILGQPSPIDIVQIRPKTELAGSAFSGLFSRDLRVDYVEAGKRAAEEALAHIC